MPHLYISLTLCLSLAFFVNAYPQTGGLIWEDNFDSLDTETWNLVTGDGCPDLCGWGNQELQNYHPENIFVEELNGEPGNFALVIEANESGTGNYRFNSGRLNSEGNLEIRYGLIEVRMQVPDLETGLWPAVWLLGANHNQVGWPESGEIDMMEMGHSQSQRNGQGYPDAPINNYVGANAIWHAEDACSAGNSSCAASIAFDAGYNKPYVADSSMSGRFVIYRLYWDASSIRFTVVDRDTEYDLYEAPFNISSGELAETFRKPFFLLMNMAVGGSFTDASNSGDVTAPLPAKMMVDYLRVYSYNNSGEVWLNGEPVSNEPSVEIPGNIKLKQNYPNPFNPVTTIEFEVPEDGPVQISVFDMQGRKIREVTNRYYVSGTHKVRFDAKGLASGIYYYRLEASGISRVGKMTLVK